MIAGLAPCLLQPAREPVQPASSEPLQIQTNRSGRHHKPFAATNHGPQSIALRKLA